MDSFLVYIKCSSSSQKTNENKSKTFLILLAKWQRSVCCTTTANTQEMCIGIEFSRDSLFCIFFAFINCQIVVQNALHTHIQYAECDRKLMNIFARFNCKFFQIIPLDVLMFFWEGNKSIYFKHSTCSAAVIYRLAMKICAQ